MEPLRIPASMYRVIRLALGATALATLPALALAQKSNIPMNNSSEAAASADAPGMLSVDQIVARLDRANKRRQDDLAGYKEERHYSVTYHGFPADLNAKMAVEVTYEAPETKDFRILSQTGSKLLADHVLKKLLTTEKAAARDPRETALSTENYSFTLLGEERVDNRPCYKLAVDPKGDSKLLYRGTIWVDADDFAVTQIDAQPAHSPSFWIRSTKIHHIYAKTGPFWLPEHNESDTDVRFGGRAVLTIDYGTYQTTAADPH